MILVVDDMTIFREPIAACLRLAGFEAECAANGSQGLSEARRLAPQLILLDMAMPDMDGLSFLRQLRADPTLARTPVIALTAVSDEKFVREAMELGACEYLLKFRTVDLLARVRRHLAPSGGGRLSARTAQ